MSKEYKVVNGTSYSVNTNDKVIEVLERCRNNRTRILIDYGDVQTKESWNEVYDISGLSVLKFCFTSFAVSFKLSFAVW